MLKANWIVSIGIVGWALSGLPAMAGNGAGNGGGAWVCRENTGAIRWSRLVDAFEAESEFGLTLAQYPGQARDIVDQVQLRIFRTNRELYEALAPYTEKVAYLEPSPPSVTYTEDVLQIIDDALYRLAPSPRRCVGGTLNYEQVVNYKNDGLILLQSEIFNSFSESAKAALVMHEAVYAYRREVAGDENSVNARRIVGLVFSTLSTEELKKALENLGESPVNPPSQTPVACGSIDLRSARLHVKCRTSKGTFFERVSRDNFGEAWKGPDGLIWSDRVGSSSQYDAVNICKNLGGTLPERADFEQGEADGFREVLPNMRNLKDRWFWSSSVSPNHPSDFAYSFYSYSGNIDFAFRTGDYSVRCVGR